MLGERPQQFLVPALILVPHKKLHGRRHFFQFLRGSQPVRPHFARAVFDALQKTRYPDFHEFIQVIRGDGQKLHPLQQRVSDVPRLLQHAPIEFQPLHVAVEVVARVVERKSFHKRVLGDHE